MFEVVRANRFGALRIIQVRRLLHPIPSRNRLRGQLEVLTGAELEYVRIEILRRE